MFVSSIIVRWPACISLDQIWARNLVYQNWIDQNVWSWHYFEVQRSKQIVCELNTVKRERDDRNERRREEDIQIVGVGGGGGWEEMEVFSETLKKKSSICLFLAPNSEKRNTMTFGWPEHILQNAAILIGCGKRFVIFITACVGWEWL